MEQGFPVQAKCNTDPSKRETEQQGKYAQPRTLHRGKKGFYATAYWPDICNRIHAVHRRVYRGEM